MLRLFLELWSSSMGFCHSILLRTQLFESLGDQFARWTSKCLRRRTHLVRLIRLQDDIFKSTVHRAVNRSGVRRYSIPLFFGTDYDVKLEVQSSFPDVHD